MPRHIPRLAVAALVTGVLVTGLLVASSASANGRFNMPTSVPQCVGVGFGPGYHAPMVLGPWWKSWSGQQKLDRVGTPLAPPTAAGDFCGPSSVDSSWDAYQAPATDGGYAPQPTLPAPAIGY
ncbi:MAG: hypothetical protein ACRCT8_03125 [Lacipirellulaceae bacterium]